MLGSLHFLDLRLRQSERNCLAVVGRAVRTEELRIHGICAHLATLCGASILLAMRDQRQHTESNHGFSFSQAIQASVVKRPVLAMEEDCIELKLWCLQWVEAIVYFFDKTFNYTPSMLASSKVLADFTMSESYFLSSKDNMARLETH